MFVLNCFLACAAKEPIVISDTEVEIWELQFTGETKGTVKMTLRRKKIEKDDYSIEGKIAESLQDHKAGPGDADYTLEGKIEKDNFRACFSGPSYMAVGAGIVHGRMKGTIFMAKGLVKNVGRKSR